MRAEILTEYAEDKLLAAVEENLLAIFSEHRPPPELGSAFYTEPNLLQVVTGVQIPLFNSVCGARLESSEVDSAIDTAMARCKARGVPLLWWVGPISLPDDLGDRLQAKGLSLVAEPPGMVLDMAALPESQTLPDGLAIIEVTDSQTHAVWTKTLVDGFGVPETWQEPLDSWMGQAAAKPQRTMRSYLGLLDGEPVATASVYLGAGVAGIYNISTVETARGRGVGRAITLRPLLDARAEGYRYSILHATEMGHSVYLKIGYRDCCTMRQYIWAEAEH